MKKSFAKKIALFAALVIVLAMFAGCGDSSTPGSAADSSTEKEDVKTIELKLSSHDPSTSDNTKMVQELADATYEATEGRVKITVHADGVLGPAPDGLTMLDTGVCDMLWTTSSLFADQFPISEIFTMPFIGADDCFDLTNAYWDLYEAHPEYFAEFEGYVPVGLYTGGQGVFATNKELNSLDDLKGMTMRVVTGPLNTMATSIGINSIMMGPGDLFLSMEKGVIEGYMFNLNGIDGFALYDVTTYAYCFGNSTWDNNIQVLMSEDAWNKLSEEDQKIIMEIWGREGSRKIVNVLYESSLRGQEIFGENFIQITEGEFYDALKAEAEAANQAYLDKYAPQGIPVNEAYEFIQERLEEYRD